MGLVSMALVVAACGGGAGPSPSPATRWERIDPSPGQGGPADVVAFGGRFVGVGGSSTWSSADLRTWQEAALGDGGTATTLVVLDGRLVAGGSIGQRAAAWLSVDGASWAIVGAADGLASATGYESSSVEALAVGPAGVVAAGTEWGSAGQRAVAWFSADGRSWARGAPELGGSGSRDVLATEGGFAIAGADDALANEVTRAAFWFSADGRRWTQAPADASFGNREPAALAARGGTMVAVGYRMTAVGFAPAIWTSTDGSRWDPAPDAPSLGFWAVAGPTPVPGQGALQGTITLAAAATGTGFLATGVRGGLDPNLPKNADGSHQMFWFGVAWQSADGRTWELLPDDPALRLGTATAVMYGPRAVRLLGDRLVLLGATPELGSTVWLGSASALGQP